MTLAQSRLSKFLDWIRLSSATERSPLGKDVILRGHYAVFCPQYLTLPPTQTVAPAHLPLWLPEEQATPGLPSLTEPPPIGQASPAERLSHIVFCFQDRRFEGALVPLTDREEPLSDALDRHLPELDLETVPLLFVPTWILGNVDRTWLVRQLPLVSSATP
jgi:hypothetical protein